MRLIWYTLFSAVLILPVGLPAQQPPPELREEAIKALKKAASFYREKVAIHGGYVYYYSLDLQQRWGEGKTGPDTIFVQPPGTPAVGMAYLSAWTATGDPYYLDAVRETAEALLYGQLESGGWDQAIHFAQPEKKSRFGKYRNGKGGDWNRSSFDDDQTQAALRFLMQADQALNFKSPAIHEAVLSGLEALLKAQFPNGAFPQGFTGPVESKPVVRASFPDYDWKTEGRVKNYWDYYTLNDNLAGKVAETLITAHQIYKDERYKAALVKLGEFLLLAQMPDPQPGWCQQYNYEMIPIWARKFEPPAITGSESQDAMKALIRIAQYTGDSKFLEPVPRALEYFRKSLLPDGKVARFYELRTNKPLYMDAQYQLTYDDSAAPGHYSWKVPARFDEIEKLYDAAKKGVGNSEQTRSAEQLGEKVRRIIQELDPEGRWIATRNGEGQTGQFISSDLFNRNVTTLSEFIKAR